MRSFIPSPSEAVWHLGPFPLRAYAMAILLGCVAAIVIGERRYRARGGRPGVIGDIAVWAIPFGIIGGRLYHVMTDPQLYFGSGRNPLDALAIWNGGLGIWGAITLGGVGAWIGARKAGLNFLPIADALAPALLVAQGIGRLGNYFNQELFGRPTTLPWGLEIDLAHRPAGYEQFATFHPTFLYELIWNLLAAALLIALDRKFTFTAGRAFALYVMAYTTGRLFTETLRIDTVNLIAGVRLNVWTTVIVFTIAVIYFVAMRHKTVAIEPVSAPDQDNTVEVDAPHGSDHAEPVARATEGEQPAGVSEEQPDE